MTKQDAYKIVYNDILNRDIGLFLGRFDTETTRRKVNPKNFLEIL